MHPLRLPQTSADAAITVEATADGGPGSSAGGKGWEGRMGDAAAWRCQPLLVLASQLGHRLKKVRGTDAGWRQSLASLQALGTEVEKHLDADSCWWSSVISIHLCATRDHHPPFPRPRPLRTFTVAATSGTNHCYCFGDGFPRCSQQASF